MIIVAGTLRVPEDRMDELMPLARATVEATREEEGCIVYSFAIDVEDGGLLRIYEDGRAANISLPMASSRTWRPGALSSPRSVLRTGT